MLQPRFALLIVLMATAVGAGAAPAHSTRLSADEVRAELFGVRLAGMNEAAGAPWEECIEPSGRTVFRFLGEVQQGHLTVESDGAACFAYGAGEASVRSCYAVVREGESYRFDALVARVVERNVRECSVSGGYVAALEHASAD